MEFKNCEEYVLNELEKSQDKILEQEETIHKLESDKEWLVDKLSDFCELIFDTYERYELPFNGDIVYTSKNSNIIDKNNELWHLLNMIFDKCKESE